jgi:hypothetical protein
LSVEYNKQDQLEECLAVADSCQEFKVSLQKTFFIFSNHKELYNMIIELAIAAYVCSYLLEEKESED